VDEGALGVHQIEFVIESGPGFGDSGGVTQHADRPLNLGQITAGDDGRRLVIDADLEAGRAPVDKLNRAFGLDGGNCGVDVFRHHIPAVEKTTGHVLSVARVALNHLIDGFEAGGGNFGDGQLLVIRLLGRDDGRVGGQGKVNPRVGNQVGLELIQIHVQRPVEA